MYNLDPNIKKELTDLSVELYKVKHKWHKILLNGLEQQAPNTKETHIETRYGKRILREYNHRYFTVDELLAYLRELKATKDADLAKLKEDKKVDKAI